jgi:hypothetical protein
VHQAAAIRFPGEDERIVTDRSSMPSRETQESIKTKHPQLLYESKLYKILQGGSASSPPNNARPTLAPPTEAVRRVIVLAAQQRVAR